MKTHRIFLPAVLIASLAFAASAVATSAVAATAKSHATVKVKAEPAKPAGQVVEYAELESRVGQTIAIETTFKTTRTGKLIKFTQPTLTLQMGTEEKPVELTVPKETIKTITVLTPTPAAEPVKDAGTSGAKKN